MRKSPFCFFGYHCEGPIFLDLQFHIQWCHSWRRDSYMQSRNKIHRNVEAFNEALIRRQTDRWHSRSNCFIFRGANTSKSLNRFFTLFLCSPYRRKYSDYNNSFWIYWLNVPNLSSESLMEIIQHRGDCLTSVKTVKQKRSTKTDKTKADTFLKMWLLLNLFVPIQLN
jgi:hypothetical protein